MITKGMVLFSFGLLLVIVSIITRISYLPQVIGILVLGLCYGLYTFVPAYSIASPVKYINIYGLLKTQNLYGAYLNFNLFDQPISRLLTAWVVLILQNSVGFFFSVYLFRRGKHLEIKKNVSWLFLSNSDFIKFTLS